MTAKTLPQDNITSKKCTWFKVYHTQEVTKNSCGIKVTILERQIHFQPLHSPKTKALKWFKSNLHTELPTCLFRFIVYPGFHVQNLSLNHVQKAVFWKKSPHTVQVYKEEIPLFSLAFLALLACVTLWEWLCKPYTL